MSAQPPFASPAQFGYQGGFMPWAQMATPMNPYSGAGTAYANQSIFSPNPGYHMPGSWEGLSQFGPLAGMAGNLAGGWLNSMASQHGMVMPALGVRYNAMDSYAASQRSSELGQLRAASESVDKSQLQSLITNFMYMQGFKGSHATAEAQKRMDQLNGFNDASMGLLIPMLSDAIMPGGSAGAFSQQAYDAYRIGGGGQRNLSWAKKKETIDQLTAEIGKEFGKDKEGAGENYGFTRRFSMGDFGSMSVALGSAGRLSGDIKQTKESLKNFAGILDAVRELGGDANAPIPVLVQKLQALSGTSLSRMDLGKVESDLRTLKALGNNFGMDTAAVGGFVESVAVQTSQLGIGSRAAPEIAKGALSLASTYWNNRDPNKPVNSFTLSAEDALRRTESAYTTALSSEASDNLGVLMSVPASMLPDDLKELVIKAKSNTLTDDEATQLNAAVSTGWSATRGKLQKSGITDASVLELKKSGIARDAMSGHADIALQMSAMDTSKREFTTSVMSKYKSFFKGGEVTADNMTEVMKIFNDEKGDGEDLVKSWAKMFQDKHGQSEDEALYHARVLAATMGNTGRNGGNVNNALLMNAWKRQESQKNSAVQTAMAEVDKRMAASFGPTDTTLGGIGRSLINKISSTGDAIRDLDKKEEELKKERDKLPEGDVRRAAIDNQLKDLALERKRAETGWTASGFLSGALALPTGSAMQKHIEGVTADRAALVEAQKALASYTGDKTSDGYLQLQANAKSAEDKLTASTKAMAEYSEKWLIDSPFSKDEKKGKRESELQLKLKDGSIDKAGREELRNSMIDWVNHLGGDNPEDAKKRAELLEHVYQITKEGYVVNEKTMPSLKMLAKDLNLQENSNAEADAKKFGKVTDETTAGKARVKATEEAAKAAKSAGKEVEKTEVKSAKTEINTDTVTISAKNSGEKPVVFELHSPSGQLVRLEGMQRLLPEAVQA